MDRNLKLLEALVAIVVATGCAIAAGRLVGGGIGRASGDTASGVRSESPAGMRTSLWTEVRAGVRRGLHHTF